MPREIADSDDELDVIPPPRVNRFDIADGITTPGSLRDLDQLDPVFNTAFDDFLSPTQRLSSYDGNHENVNDIDTSKFLDSSTNRFLEALAPSSGSPSQHTTDADPTSQLADPDMGGKRSKGKAPGKATAGHKRSWTEIEQSEAPAKENTSTKKKAKSTRRSSVTSNVRSKDVLDFETDMYDGNEIATGIEEHDIGLNGDTVANPMEMISVDARTDYTSPLDLSLHLSPMNGAQVAANENSVRSNPALTGGSVPHQPYAPHGDFFGANLRGGTTSNSSMGNYQSFSINPERLGMDFDKINPFGSLSQVSLPGDLDSEETRGIAEIFRNSASYSTTASSTNGAEVSNVMTHGVEHEMQTSPVKGDGARRTTKSRKTERDNAQCSPLFSPITNPDDENTIDENIATRCGDQEYPIMVDTPEPKPAPKKRGRKPKNQKPTELLEPDWTSVDELHPEDLPVHRATRAGTVDSVSNASEISQGTNSGKTGRKRKLKTSDMGPPELQSKKLPSSDLGLDNKAVIGLSPERYVPRPSKRRGRTDPQTLNSSEINGAVVDEDVDPTEEASRPVVTKGKKGRKAKGKGVGKPTTTPVKELGESVAEDPGQEMEESDEISPADVKVAPSSLPKSGLDQEPNIETTIDEDDEDDEDRDDVITRSGNRRAKISVDIPVLPKPDDQEDLVAPIAEPKKRGRKRKKALEAVSAENKDDGTQRPALGEIDPNIQVGRKKLVESFKDEDADHEEEKGGDSETETRQEEKGQIPVAVAEEVTATTPCKKSSTPLKPLSSTPLFNARARIGLSKRHSIPSLLRKVDRNKEAPKAIERKEKLNKRQLEEKEQERIAREEAEAEGREYKPLDQLRDKDGRLVEWDF